MAFYFKPFPKTSYNLNYSNSSEIVTNLLVRFKIEEILRNNKTSYYQIEVEEGEKPWQYAQRVYDRADLDWLVFLVNNIVDPYYDWPLGYSELNSYIKSKYGKVETAQTTIHEYRKILNQNSVLFDGTIVSKRTLVVDQTTYDSLTTDEREIVYKYDYEVELNDNKRNIKSINPRDITRILNQIEDIFEK